MKTTNTILLTLCLTLSVISNASNKPEKKFSISSIFSSCFDNSAVIDPIIEMSAGNKSPEVTTKSMTITHSNNKESLGQRNFEEELTQARKGHQAQIDLVKKTQELLYKKQLALAEINHDKDLAQAQKEHAALIAIARVRDNKKYQDQLTQTQKQHNRTIDQYSRQANDIIRIKEMVIKEQSDRLDSAVIMLKFLEVDQDTLNKHIGLRPRADSEESFQ